MVEWTPVEPPPEQVAEVLLRDLSLVNELTDPTRSAIVFRLKQPHSAAELAAALEVPVTRLYHHLNRLEQAGLITVVATRRSGARIERRYCNTAASYRLDPAVVTTSSASEFAHALAAMFDLAKHQLRHEIERGALPPGGVKGRATIGINELLLTEEQRASLVRRLTELFDEYAAYDSDNAAHPVDGVGRFDLFIAGFPVTG